MPFIHDINMEYGGLLDTDNITLNEEYNKTYNPNSEIFTKNLEENKLFWSIDFGRTEHPIGYNQSNVWGTIKNQSVLQEVIDIFPTLLGIDKWNNYWEWTWQSVGITKYMHYPEFWGYLRFIDNKNSKYCQNIEWPARYLIHSLWWANYQYFIDSNGTKYTNDINELLNEQYCQFGYCDLNGLKQAVYANDTCFKFYIEIDSNRGCPNYVNNNNFTMNDKLYSAMCYHASVVVNVDDNIYNNYIINITESHFVTVQRQNYSLCL